MRPKRINEFRKRPPTVREIREAQKLAAKVSKDLLEMMGAKPTDKPNASRLRP
jgi:hypothetical protein